MNRKVINGLLLLAAATAGCGTFTSCKDTDEDYRNEIAVRQDQLQKAIDALKDQVNGIKSCTCDLEGAISKLKAELEGQIKDLENKLGEVSGDVDKLDGRVGEIEAKLQQLVTLQNAIKALEDRMAKAEDDIKTAQQTADDAKNGVKDLDGRMNTAMDLIAQNQVAIETLRNELSGRLDQVESDVDGLQEEMTGVKSRLDALEALDIDNRLNKAQQDATAALTLAQLNSSLIEALDQRVAALEGEIPAIKGRLDGIDEELRTLNATVTEILDDVDNLWVEVRNNQADIDAIWEYIDRHKVEFEQLQNRVEEAFGALNERLNKYVTGLNVNGTYNHVFGSFSAPFGIRSNMLFAYYGSASDSFDFPSVSTAHNYDGPNNPVITSQDIMRLRQAGMVPTSFVGGEVYMTNEGDNLGKLYATVNPTNRNFKGLRPELVKSNNEMAPVSLSLRPGTSDDVLDWGLTRTQSTTGNGFYVANVNVDVKNTDAIDELRLEVEPGLKSAMKDVLLDRSKKDIAKLAKLVYEQMSSVCPAYAMKVEWDDPNGLDASGNATTVKNSVVSGYDLAVATVKPLGYSFAVDFSTSRRLKEITPMTEVLDRIFNDAKNDVQIDLGLTAIDHIVIDWSSVTGENGFQIVGGEVVIPSLPIYEANADGTPNKNKIIGYTDEIRLTYDPQNRAPLADGTGALNDFVASIVASVNKYIGKPGDDASLIGIIDKQVKDQVNGMIDDINKQLLGLDAKVEENIDKILDKIHDQLNGHLTRVDNVISKINTLIGKLNNVLSDPNNYLQVMMAYRAADGEFHHLSTSLSDPTRLTKGSANGLELFATSYTAELIAPSYQKLVGVTNVYKNGQEAVNAEALAKKVNTAKGSLARVTTGNNQRFAVNSDFMEAGYTYEFLYTSVDYRGYVSSRKYYIQVN